MSITQLFLFFALCVVIVYILNCVIARKILHVDAKMLAVYVSAMMLIGVFGEIFINQLYQWIVGHSLWEYRVLPIHDAHSSRFAFFLWGVYGLHIYLLHGVLDGTFFNSKLYMRYCFWLEGVAIEFVTNSLFLLWFGTYLFYYPANDLWHITSVQGFPCYFAASFVIVSALKRFKKDPKFFIVMNLLLTGVIVFFTG